MNRHVEDGGIMLKNVLCAIAMMDVPVQYKHPLCTCPLRSSCCNCCIVEEAKAHGHAAFCVMPRWPHNGSPTANFTPVQQSMASDEVQAAVLLDIASMIF